MIHYKDLLIDTAAQRVYRQEQEVHMTRTEYRLLLVLLSGAGRVFTREELLHRVWGITVPIHTRTVDIHIAACARNWACRGRFAPSCARAMLCAGRPSDFCRRAKRA